MCDNALLTGFGLGRQPVDSEMVLEVANDFDLQEARPTTVVSFIPPSTVDVPIAEPESASATETTADESDEPQASKSVADGAPASSSVADDRPMFTAARPRARFSLFGTR
jgi:hypothetical protein